MITRLMKKDWEMNVSDAISKANWEGFIYQDTTLVDDKSSMIELRRTTKTSTEYLLLFVSLTGRNNVFNAIIMD